MNTESQTGPTDTGVDFLDELVAMDAEHEAVVSPLDPRGRPQAGTLSVGQMAGMVRGLKDNGIDVGIDLTGASGQEAVVTSEESETTAEEPPEETTTTAFALGAEVLMQALKLKHTPVVPESVVKFFNESIVEAGEAAKRELAPIVVDKEKLSHIFDATSEPEVSGFQHIPAVTRPKQGFIANWKQRRENRYHPTRLERLAHAISPKQAIGAVALAACFFAGGLAFNKTESAPASTRATATVELTTTSIVQPTTTRVYSETELAFGRMVEADHQLRLSNPTLTEDQIQQTEAAALFAASISA